LKGAIDVLDDNEMPDCKTADLIVSKLLEKGVIISNSRCRHLGNTLMLQPPLITTKKQLRMAFEALNSVLHEIYSLNFGESPVALAVENPARVDLKIANPKVPAGVKYHG